MASKLNGMVPDNRGWYSRGNGLPTLPRGHTIISPRQFHANTSEGLVVYSIIRRPPKMPIVFSYSTLPLLLPK